jgi:hypothetical protein
MAASYHCNNEDGDDDLLLRRLILCEEDRRRLYPAIPWTGGYRWFRSPNIIDLEARRKAKATETAPPTPRKVG